MTKEFQGFSNEGLKLLPQLPGYSEAEYNAAKAVLDAGLRKPGLALAEAIASSLDANLTVTARGSVSAFHRDLRFAKAGTPRYKDHLMLTAWTGADKKTSPTLWLRMDGQSVGFASGIAFTPEIRDRFRQAVAGKAGAGLDQALAKITKKHHKHRVQVAGDLLKKVPRPYAADHPRAELLRRNGFQVRFVEDIPASFNRASFVAWCVKRLTDLLPVHHWLVKHVG